MSRSRPIRKRKTSSDVIFQLYRESARRGLSIFGSCFSIKQFSDTQILPGDDQYKIATSITLVSKMPFTWGREKEISSAKAVLFKDVLGGFAQRSYPPGYTFTRAVEAIVTANRSSGEAVKRLEPNGTPGADVLPPKQDFAAFIVGRWNGSFAFEFRPDGTWSLQKPDSPMDALGRRWAADGDVLTLTEPAHVNRYTNLSVSGQQLTLWNQNGPLTLTRVQSAIALNVQPHPAIPGGASKGGASAAIGPKGNGPTAIPSPP